MFRAPKIILITFVPRRMGLIFSVQILADQFITLDDLPVEKL